MARVPALVDEVRRIAGTLQEAAKPSTKEQVLHRVLRIMAAWGVTEKDAKEHSAGLTLWVEALMPLPMEAIEAGVLECGRTCKFLPRPAEVYQAALPKANELRLLAYRAKKAAEHAERTKPPTQERMTKAEMIAAGFMDEAGNVILGKSKPIPPVASRPRETPQQAAEKIRRAAEEDVAI